ncbi:MAG: hypothetical protein IPP07_05800 [Holophagales bacterium]|nr:hypothetical protein [Holophagales bacterium]MBK9964426.1 hypothetical protein [Holophagales bacterium]
MTTVSNGLRKWVVTGLFAVLALLVVPVFPHFVSPNELTRWALAAAVVEDGSLEVTERARLLGPRMEDVAEVEGRLYSNKAPGTTLAALPGYLAARPFAGPPSASSLRLSLTAMRLAGATLPVLLLAVLFARLAPEEGRTEALFGLLFATPLFAYSLLLFAHALVAACLFGAWAALFAPGTGAASASRDVAAGLLLGLAVFSEYPAAIPALVLVGVAAWGAPARLLRIVVGGLPFAALLAAHNAACFGSPFRLSSGLEKDPSFRALASQGLFGVGLPRPSILARLLLDPSKGLLVFTPLLLLFPSGLAAARRRLPPRSFVALVLVPLALLLTYGGYPNWHGGFTVGARYLVGALPFLLLPLAFVRWGPLATALAGASTAAVALTTLVFPFVPPGFPLPWGSFAAPLLAKGLVAPNLLHLVWRPLAVLVPFALVLAAAAVATGRKRLAPFLGGAFLWTAAGLALPLLVPLSPPLVVQRGYVEEVFFTREGALARAMPPGVPVPPRLRARKELEETLPPTGWPF